MQFSSFESSTQIHFQEHLMHLRFQSNVLRTASRFCTFWIVNSLFLCIVQCFNLFPLVLCKCARIQNLRDPISPQFISKPATLNCISLHFKNWPTKVVVWGLTRVCSPNALLLPLISVQNNKALAFFLSTRKKYTRPLQNLHQRHLYRSIWLLGLGAKSKN